MSGCHAPGALPDGTRSAVPVKRTDPHGMYVAWEIRGGKRCRLGLLAEADVAAYLKHQYDPPEPVTATTIALGELLALVTEAWPVRWSQGRITHVHRNAIRTQSGALVHLRILIQELPESYLEHNQAHAQEH